MKIGNKIIVYWNFDDIGNTGTVVKLYNINKASAFSAKFKNGGLYIFWNDNSKNEYIYEPMRHINIKYLLSI